ncbi:neurofibromin [Podospora australis]|uniref:Neurofibromin n=1 Tax=Podospora australis TaxID=1536484 RepID=A0AAN7AK97_9PEZI|nr:neurofibromin [Podospora australis]
MNGDAGLVGCLVDRLTTRLPHRTGTPNQDLSQDDIVNITRATLVSISASSISLVLDALLGLLEDLARPHKGLITHPPHVLLSELYVLELIADCCAGHWYKLRNGADVKSTTLPSIPTATATTPNPTSASVGPLSPSQRATFHPPEPLNEALLARMFESIKVLFEPIPEGYILPSKTILDDSSAKHIALPAHEEPTRTPLSTNSSEPPETSRLLQAQAPTIEAHIKMIVEYVTASSWPRAFEFFRTVIYNARLNSATQGAPVPIATAADEERAALVMLRLTSFFWVDLQKLNQVITEFCSSFLHFRKSFQNTVAVVMPQLITRWLDRYPAEFVAMHSMQKRRENAPDTLFDMTQTVVDNGRRKAVLFPMQISLLFLLPDVFEVASNMREAKSGSMTKKVQFLEGLRKALRNRNEQATYCLVLLLRAARHFDADSDSALLSYAMDVQDEIKDAVFRRFPPGGEAILFDQDIMTAAFVSLSHLNFDSCVDSLAQTCLVPSAPQNFKISVIQACAYFARLGDNRRYRRLFTAASAFIQNQLQTMSELLHEGYIEEQPTQRKLSESAPMVSMISNILNFLDASPMTLFEGPPTDRNDRDRFYEQNLEALIACIVAADESVRRLATGVAKRLFADEPVLKMLRASKGIDSKAFKSNFWRLTSLILMSICDRARIPCTADGLRLVQGYLESRLHLLTSIPELGEISEDVAERTAASTKLETLFLVSLCSAEIEICPIVTSCIGTFLEECRLIDTTPATAKSSLTLLRNAEVFGEISSRAFRFTGIVAFQKRIRGLLRRMQYPSAGILDAWELVFDRWIHLSKDLSLTAVEGGQERLVAEWRNYSGFLASLGGICTAEQAINIEEPAVSGLRWIDRISSGSHEEPLLARYLRLSIQLLACANVRIRETMREVLSTEVPPSLYQPLFKALETELDVLFTGALEPSVKGADNDVVFAEQSSSLLKALVERLDTPSDLGAASSLHLGALTLNFAKFLDGIVDTPSSLRVKIKVCQLCEAVTKRKEYLNLRDDVRIRNQLLEYIFSWIARPRSPRGDSSYSNNRDEMVRIQHDLDKACLRSLAELTFRLPLQPNDGQQTDAGTSELKSQMFQQYFNRFLSLLNMETNGSELGSTHHGHHFHGHGALASEVSTSDLAITILSNLLSANIDVGLKHSLSIGYHENVEIRTAFVKVLYNILVQGTEFNNLSDTAVNEKYDELIELLTNDTSLATAMSAVCPSHEVDELTVSLLNIFETRGLSFVLLEALIKQEVEDTENESELLRRTCVATKMLSIYAKWKGAGYLKATLQNVVERLMLTSNDLNLELDPTRVSSPEELQTNAEHLQIVAKVFIDNICASSASIPPAFRKICSIISATVVERFPDAKYTAVGAFIFLRFFCPAIVAPEVEGLVSKPPSKEMRRGLLLIAKVVQNLANNVLFGVKEPYMYPLIDFLTNNIYRVTTFLREISVTPTNLENTAGGESSDFGSCVALHGFLYEHWDHVRQRLVSQERRDFVRSPAESTRMKTPVLEPLRNLIMNLGPPPLAVTWNRPQISANSPPSYSRFQDFMLRNAFRSPESFLTERAVYDGGESKDGLSIICIILRNIDAESIDYDTLIYCYLKIASRLWHRPFGILIDATCYNGQPEPKDELFQKLEMLTPTELSKQLARVYIYNMNSACKKCFRRVLRLSAKSETSVFSPNNVEYHLVGSMHDLQAHFHLSQVHLPKDTVSVVTDTRYVFQGITRLSKSKGKIDVTIKVGSQFVQVTTVKKQEVPGFRLSTTVNDIFRVGDVDEAPTSIQTEGNEAFGLRADNGKIVMYFTSPKKTDVLQAIRSAKAKYGKDTRALKSFERLIRPQDVPGTLLNLALTNLASSDPTLRLSSYNLLGALCKAFKFRAATMLMAAKDISVPLDPSQFIINISKKLAQTEPQLTSDFLNEFFVGWDSFSDEQKPLSLAYMAPWIPGLRTSLLASEVESDKGKEKIAALFRKLIDVTLSDPTLTFILEQSVWPVIHRDEVLLDIFLEEVIKTALSIGFMDDQTETLTSIASAIGTITLRGRIISRLRKALNRSSLRSSKYLPENAVWNEICVLLQFCLALSFDSGVQAQLYLPEIFHIVTMLANTGLPDVRVVVHRLLINSIHSACTSFALDEVRLNKLRATLETLSDPKNDIFVNSVTYVRDGASISTNQDAGPTLTATENLATILFETCSVAAPSVDVANAWRSRWMSLVASTAFQNNPAIQPRAFTVMGCLAREEVDDDLLYQVLVALRNSVGRFGDDTNSDMLVAIVTSLSKMMAKLPSASRYGLQLFWLAISLLRLVPSNLFNCTAQFLESVLTNISTSGDMRGEKMVPYLLQGRNQLEEAALPLDDAYGIHFNNENFHFAACACLVRGLTDTVTKATALRVLSTFLEMTTSPLSSSSAIPPPVETGGDGGSFQQVLEQRNIHDLAGSPYMALILARINSVDELRENLWAAGISPAGLADLSGLRASQDVLRLKDKDLLLNTAIELVDFQYLEDAVQNRSLAWLNEIALGRPSVVMHLCGPIITILDDILLHCQSSATLESAHRLLQTLTSNPKFASALESTAQLNETLDDMGFGGLWRSCSFNLSSQEMQTDRTCFVLTEKLIEVCLFIFPPYFSPYASPRVPHLGS